MKKNFLKRTIFDLAVGIISLCIIFISTTVFAEANIKVELDGKELEFDVPPQLISDRTMVPMRKIFEEMGTHVEWDNSTKTVTATNENSVIKATINSNIMLINGTPKTMDIAPQLVDDRTLVPARFVAEALGATVEWNGETSTVVISSMNLGDNFTTGFEKADINKVDEYIYEGDDERTKLHLSCTINDIMIEKGDETTGDLIIADAIDSDGNNWKIMLNVTSLADENGYDEFIGKRVTLVGFYWGKYETPYIGVYKIRDDFTKRTENGIESVFVEEISSETQTMYTVDGKTKNVLVHEVRDYQKLSWYTEPVEVLHGVDGSTIVVSQTDVNKYLELGWKREDLSTTVPNQNHVGNENVHEIEYGRLKDFIISYGKKNNAYYLGETEEYNIYHHENSTNYSVMFKYMNMKLDDGTKKDFITLYLSLDGMVESSLMINLYRDKNPNILYTVEISEGNEGKIHGDFPYANKPFVESINEIPVDLHDSSYKLLASEFAVIDMILQDYSGLSLGDFGISYSYEINDVQEDEYTEEDASQKKETDKKDQKTELQKKKEYDDYIKKYKTFYLSNGKTLDDLEKDARAISGYGYESKNDEGTEKMSDAEKRQYDKQKLARKGYDDYIKKYKQYYLSSGKTIETLEKDAQITTGYDPKNKWGI